jgi:hypothetical protein
MKVFNDLTDAQKTAAIDHCYTQLLTDILEHGIRFNDEMNQDDTQARIDKAVAKAEAKQTPWFAHEYIADDKKLVECLRGMAECTAEDAMYSEPTDGPVIDGIIK